MSLRMKKLAKSSPFEFFVGVSKVILYLIVSSKDVYKTNFE